MKLGSLRILCCAYRLLSFAPRALTGWVNEFWVTPQDDINAYRCSRYQRLKMISTPQDDIKQCEHLLSQNFQARATA
eukprot:4554732-Prymnesium_polylepis.1